MFSLKNLFKALSFILDIHQQDASSKLNPRDPKNMDKYIGDINAWEKSRSY